MCCVLYHLPTKKKNELIKKTTIKPDRKTAAPLRIIVNVRIFNLSQQREVFFLIFREKQKEKKIKNLLNKIKWKLWQLYQVLTLSIYKNKKREINSTTYRILYKDYSYSQCFKNTSYVLKEVETALFFVSDKTPIKTETAKLKKLDYDCFNDIFFIIIIVAVDI